MSNDTGITCENEDLHLLLESARGEKRGEGAQVGSLASRTTTNAQETTFWFAYEHVSWKDLRVMISPKRPTTVLGEHGVLCVEYDEKGNPTSSEVKHVANDSEFAFDHPMHIRTWMASVSPSGAFSLVVQRQKTESKATSSSSSSSASSSSAPYVFSATTPPPLERVNTPFVLEPVDRPYVFSTTTPPPLERDEETWVTHVKTETPKKRKFGKS